MSPKSAGVDTEVLATAEQIVGHLFTQTGLLVEALTHSSTVGGGRRSLQVGRRSRGQRKRSNERLEFLGDRVLGLVVAHLLIEAFPDDAEGALSQRHDALVRRETLAEIAGELGLGQLLLLARGEIDGGGRSNPGILADCCEAILGALYLDGGMTAAEQFIRRHWTARLGDLQDPPRDAKTALQEWAQGRGFERPTYLTVQSSGPAHAPTFHVEVQIEPDHTAGGEGSSKRAAEQAAAEILLRRLTERYSDG